MLYDLSTAILNVLRRLRKPVEVDEIAFRVRSTSTLVQERLDSLYDAKLVKKIDDTHFEIARPASWLYTLFNY